MICHFVTLKCFKGERERERASAAAAAATAHYAGVIIKQRKNSTGQGHVTSFRRLTGGFYPLGRSRGPREAPRGTNLRNIYRQLY